MASFEDSTMNNGIGNGDGNHALRPFFGSVEPQYQKMLAEDKFAHETYNLPKAYEGKNKHLETVLDYLITEEDAWYTSTVLPWVLTDDLSVKWEIFRFNKRKRLQRVLLMISKIQFQCSVNSGADLKKFISNTHNPFLILCIFGMNFLAELSNKKLKSVAKPIIQTLKERLVKSEPIINTPTQSYDQAWSDGCLNSTTNHHVPQLAKVMVLQRNCVSPQELDNILIKKARIRHW